MIFKSQIQGGRIRLSNGQRWVSFGSNAEAWAAAKALNADHPDLVDGKTIAALLKARKEVTP